MKLERVPGATKRKKPIKKKTIRSGYTAREICHIRNSLIAITFSDFDLRRKESVYVINLNEKK